MEVKAGDKVRFKKNINAAYGPPDRRNVVASVKSVSKDVSGIKRLDLQFEGETKGEAGRLASQFEKVT